ncbi:MAG TPA: hypothetical protein VD835_15370 [Pyrinomonadaceae bacterium]|nr:hypothetical protein [Pyrinomonadaceae bacterium]
MKYPRHARISKTVQRSLRFFIVLLVVSGSLFVALAVSRAVEVGVVGVRALASNDAPARPSTASGQQDVETRKIEKVFRKYDTLKLDPGQVAAEVRNGGKLSLVVADETLELELEPNDMRAANYRAEEARDGGEVNGLDSGTLTRAQALRAVADSDQVSAAEYNRAFVAMQYYGYLRRAPEADGYHAWLRVINEDPQNVRVMVNGFMNSVEYRLRFGQP